MDYVWFLKAAQGGQTRQCSFKETKYGSNESKASFSQVLVASAFVHLGDSVEDHNVSAPKTNKEHILRKKTEPKKCKIYINRQGIAQKGIFGPIRTVKHK